MSKRHFLVQYGVAVLAVGVALLLKLALFAHLTREAPYLLFFLSVAIAALFGGMGPGLFATVLAAGASNYFFVHPHFEFDLADPTDEIFFATFVGECLLITFVCAKLRTARSRAEHSASEARMLEQKIVETTDRETERIGHDLHDGLGQQLTGIALLCRRLEQRLATTQSAEYENARKICSLINDAVAVSHDLAHALSAPMLKEAGLPTALRELAANAEKIFSIQCQVQSQAGKNEFPPSLHLYRIAQEAISNAVRHGKASRIQITLTRADGRIVQSIIDNGSGFQDGNGNAKSLSNEHGLGLQIMRHRARMMGAHLEIRQHPEGGTIVTCELPASRGSDV